MRLDAVISVASDSPCSFSSDADDVDNVQVLSRPHTMKHFDVWLRACCGEHAP